MKLIYNDLRTGNLVVEELPDTTHKPKHLLLDEKTYDVTAFFLGLGGKN